MSLLGGSGHSVAEAAMSALAAAGLHAPFIDADGSVADLSELDIVHAAQQSVNEALAAATAAKHSATTAAAGPGQRTCGRCGNTGTLSRCSRCLQTYYCSTACQAADWKKHKASCHKAASVGSLEFHATNGAGHPHTHTAACGFAGAHSHGKGAAPAYSAAALPPPSSSASTRSSVASSSVSSSQHGKEASTLVGATSSDAHALGHSHSHGGHSHSHGSSVGHSHGHNHNHTHAPVHSCASPSCPHKARAAEATSAAATPAAPVSAAQLPHSSTASYAAASSSSAAPAPSAVAASASGASSSASSVPAVPPPVHSQTSYSPVPISNVSASSRHIYVPPCRPLLRPSALSFPLYVPGHAITPPLSCMHGFGANLLFNPSETVRILYADLGDVRHVIHSLVDLHAKMKAWKKKMNSAAAAAAAAGGSAGADKKNAASRKATADGLPLPPPPAPLSKLNPNIGIEFHLNDPNPHVLARAVLFLVSAYVSSALMNAQMSMATATGFGIPVPSTPPTLAQHVSNSAYSTAAIAAAALSLSSYRAWSPADHWLYLLFLYGNYQMPLQFLRRTTETLQLLVRLTGGRMIREDLAATQGSNSASDPLPPPPAPVDSTLFSHHPYTFFLQLPSIGLALLLPIWRAWEDVCHRGCMAAAADASAAATAAASSPPNPFHLPPVDQPVFPPSDVSAAHPGEPDIVAQINHFYKHGCVLVNSHTFPASRSRKELLEGRAAHAEAQAAAAAAAAAATASANQTEESKAPQFSPLPELLPPSSEEYSAPGSYLLNPTVFPFNFSSLPFSSSLLSGAPSSSSSSLHAQTRPSSPLVAANLLAEVSQKWCFAREPFSLLLPRLSTGSSSASSASSTSGKDKGDTGAAAAAASSSSGGTGLLGSTLELMSKMSHALFWVVQFQQSAAAAASSGKYGSPASGAVGTSSSAAAAAAASSIPRSPYVRLYLYHHDLYFHLHTYDFLFDRVLVYNQADYVGLQSLILMARPRMKNGESILECVMNFPSCMTAGHSSANASTGAGSGTSAASASSSATQALPDLHKFCLLSLNANPKLVRNIFGWDMSLYSYPIPGGSGGACGAARGGNTVVRLTLADYSLDVSAPPGHPSDGSRVINDWFMTSIQPILLHEEFQSMDAGALELLRGSTPRSHCNLRTFCMLVGLLVKQGHLDQMASRHRLVTLFATLLTPRSPYQMDHLFTSLLTHIGLLKSELLPLIYLLLSPLEDTTLPTLSHNSLFFKGLWQLELVSMKFEPLVLAMHAQQAQVRGVLNGSVSHSYTSGGASGTSKTKLAQQAKISKGAAGALPEFDWNCRLCALAGPNHCHHQQHAAPGSAAAAVAHAGGAHANQSALREPLLSLLFVTLPSACPAPPNSASTASSVVAGGPMGSAAGPLFPSSSPSSSSPSPHPLTPGSVAADSPLAWVNLRDVSLLRWLRSVGRGAQVLDVVDVDWSAGQVTAWVNRTYVHYVRKCSAHAQVCLMDFEKMNIIAPPRSVVHLKTLRSVNIR